MAKLTVEMARRRLERNGAIIAGKTIYIEKPGLKCLSAIDSLRRHAGFKWRKERYNV
jgi:hypothetical protein